MVIAKCETVVGVADTKYPISELIVVRIDQMLVMNVTMNDHADEIDSGPARREDHRRGTGEGDLPVAGAL